MRILIAGVDGYLGWALAQHLAGRGHELGGVDNFNRRKWVDSVGSCSATPITAMSERLIAFRRRYGSPLQFWDTDLSNYSAVEHILQEFRPDAIVHFGECPSAPFSMRDVHHTVMVQNNNINSTFNLIFAIRDKVPGCHLVKLGTMGEYGTPGIDIPEGFFDLEYKGKTARMPFPRLAGSWYHWSKVHGSNNIMFACKIYNLCATDVMQGVVFGTRANAETESAFLTRLDFDECFGTAINRFCCQAVIGSPLTPYGAGGQRRGFLPLRDSMQCLTLALENPPHAGEYRVFNQFEEIYGIAELASKVQHVGRSLGLTVEIANIENPRIELEDHYYAADHDHLAKLGYRPSTTVEDEIAVMLEDLTPCHPRIHAYRDVLIPSIRWDGSRRKSRAMTASVG